MIEPRGVPSISVVIPQWGQFPLTARAVGRLRTFESSDIEIIVVDDGSPDLEDCSFRSDASMIFVQQPHQGVTAAWNRGAEHARGSSLVFLNNDVQIEGPFLNRLIHPLCRPDTVASGCCWRRERSVPRSIAKRLPRELLEGWCFAVRRIDFETIGGFDARLRLYYSDTDLQWRLLLQESGSRLERVPDLPLAHEGHVSTRRNPHRRELHGADRQTFLQKWKSE